MIGKRLGHYEITEHLGTGGMGEVYRALDTKLKRDVALKLLPTEFSEDPERTARFEREATTLASLQHTNIASIYGFEQDQNRRFLIMEMVEGEELAARLERGPIPLDEALDIALQIAEGLEAAHAQGVVHRDLKPANIKITPTHDVKILDFGLARAYSGEAADGGETEIADSPTITAAMTQAGVILGTAAYMSPEQARGRSVDQQSDIWSFGVVLYEMLTSDRLFGGETISDSIGAILHRAPDLDRLSNLPRPLTRLLRRCLERDKKRRLRDIGDAKMELEDASTADRTTHEELRTRGSTAPWIAAAVLLLLSVGLAWVAFAPRSNRQLPITTVGIPKDAVIDAGRDTTWPRFDLSPDGTQVVWAGGKDSSLYLRKLDSFESTRLADTEFAAIPVFSHDGRWIAYYRDGKLCKIATSGGAPLELCDTLGGPGICWGEEELYFKRSDGGGIWRISATGGTAVELTTLDDTNDETSHRWPRLLPGGTHLLITIKTARISSFDDASIGIVSLESGEVRRVFTGGSAARYVDSGHLVYGRNSQLFAVPFDLKTMEVTGTPSAVLSGVTSYDVNGASYFALSQNGALAYIPKPPEGVSLDPVWFDRDGKTTPLELDDATRGNFYEWALSPDGTRLAGMRSAANDKIWVHDMRRNSASRLSNTPGNDSHPAWSSDGKYIAYTNDRQGNWDVYWMPADGSAAASMLLNSSFAELAQSFSPDGKHLAYIRDAEDGKPDIWILSMDEDRESTQFFESIEPAFEARFSPDGKWLAYAAGDYGSEEVYLRPFPGPGPAIRISNAGGFNVEWARDGSELYYSDREGAFMATPIQYGSALNPGEPYEVFPADPERSWLMMPGNAADRFLGHRFNAEAANMYEIRVAFDWTDKLEAIR